MRIAESFHIGYLLVLFVIQTTHQFDLAHLTVAAGPLVLATAGGSGQLYLGAFVIAIGMAWNVPLLMLIAVDSASDVDRSKVVATVTTFGDFANSAGALFLGLIADAAGYEGMYVAVAGGAVLAVVLMRSRFMAPVAGLRRPVGGAGAALVDQS